MTERDFQRRVLETARLFGWRIYHHRPAMVGGRVVTALEGDAGFPDLILCRPPRLILAELKVGRNKPSEAQQQWLGALGACSGVEAYLWRPEDWDAIQDSLHWMTERRGEVTRQFSWTAQPPRVTVSGVPPPPPPYADEAHR